ncbi:MerR family DNA-binding transcriptional regulator, partial [Pseudomonas gingeri]|uniref:MerR family DNA-binding transcriptional regulator n=1 Tax=Pseudomonas gingeri TaxID=117681 RepID=UPI00159FE460
MRIGELARACVVSCDTLRFYEQRGLIVAQRSANGYRDYPAEMVQLVQYIKTAQ